MKRIVFLCLIALCFTAVGQNRVLKHKKETNFSIPGYENLGDIQNCYFDYNYYEAPSGDYVKHGDFKISGSRTYEYYEYYKKNTVTDTYNATGKYVDGLLDGVLSVSRIVKINEKTVLWKLTAGFKEGFPHGEWRLISDSKTMFVCHFKNGEMVGSVDMNYLNGKGYVTMKGNIDENRQYDGTWRMEDVYGETHEYEFVHGILCRYIHRDANGNVQNKSDQDLQNIERIKEVANQLYNKQISQDDLAAMGFEYKLADKIQADNMIGELYDSDVHYGFEMIGGQQKDNRGYMGKWFSPHDYLELTYYPVLSDEYMNALIRNWENDIQKYQKGSFLALKTTTLPDCYFTYNDYRITIQQKKQGENKHLLPGFQNTQIDFFNEKERFSCTITSSQADTLNTLIDKMLKIFSIKEQLDQKAKSIQGKENELKSLSQDAYTHYRNNIGLFDYDEREPYREQEITDRLNVIENYSSFAKEANYIQKNLCPNVLNKANSLPIKEDVMSYINAIDYKIRPTEKNVSFAMERLNRSKQYIQSFDTLIDLQKNFATIKKQIEQKIEVYDRINASFTEYVKKIELPNNINPGSINTMKEINSNMQKVLHTVDTLINLQKTYYSLKDQIEQIASSYKQIFATYTTYISETGVPSGVEPENLTAMREINSNMQKILNTLKSSELKALEKEIKSFKNDEAAKIKRLIGD